MDKTKQERKITTEKISGISETLMIPLWARATETKKKNRIIVDEKAVELIKKIDYEFSKFKTNKDTQIRISIRTKIIDNVVKSYISRHPYAVIVNLGAGLDTRFFRLDNNKIQWYDLDLPKVIVFKNFFFRQTNRFKFIPKTVFDFSWMKEIEKIKKNHILFIAEGLFIYFKENLIFVTLINY